MIQGSNTQKNFIGKNINRTSHYPNLFSSITLSLLYLGAIHSLAHRQYSVSKVSCFLLCVFTKNLINMSVFGSCNIGSLKMYPDIDTLFFVCVGFRHKSE